MRDEDLEGQELYTTIILTTWLEMHMILARRVSKDIGMTKHYFAETSLMREVSTHEGENRII